MLIPFLQDFARNWGVGSGELGFLFGTYAVTMLATLPFAGWVCDRVGPGRSLRLGAAGLFLSLVVFGAANGHTMLFLARIVQGAAAAMTWTGGLALLAAAFPAERRGRALGTAMFGMSLGTVVGPLIGGRLFDWGGARMPFLIFAAWALSLVVLLMTARLPRRCIAEPARTGGTRGSVFGLLTYGRTAGIVVIGAMLMSALEPTLPTSLEARLGGQTSMIGDLIAIAALAYGIASPPVGWAVDRWGGRPMMAIGLIACALVLPLAALPKTWWREASVLAGFGVSLAMLLSPTLAEIAAACERNGAGAFGAAYAVFNFVYAVGMVVGQVAGGALASAFGFGPALCIFAVVTVAYLPILLRKSSPPQTTVEFRQAA